MELDWQLYRERFEKVREIAEERLPEDEFHVKSTVWTTGNFRIEAVHGKTNTQFEEAVLCDEDGNTVFEERERENGDTKKIHSGEMLESPEDLSYEEWESRRMEG